MVPKECEIEDSTNQKQLLAYARNSVVTHSRLASYYN